MTKKILVVGDSISDVYRSFQYIKQCPDAPSVPVGMLYDDEIRPGGAANVAANIAILAPSDCSVSLISLVDSDLVHSLKDTGASVDLSKCHIVRSDRALRKERILLKRNLGNDDFIVRLDNRSSIDPHDSDFVVHSVREYLSVGEKPDFVVLSDYNGGILTDRLMTELEPVRDRLLIDTKKRDLRCFRGSLFAKLNESEYRDVLLADHSPEINFKYFVVTRGDMGARLMIRKNLSGAALDGSICMMSDFRGHAVKAIDPCGCGDTFLAGLAAGMARYADPFEAVLFANAAASTVVTQPRTAIADLKKTLELTGREV